MDRRMKYTKKVLNDSLITFLEEKEITKITVTEICKAADINRSTYYAHFMDPYDQLSKLKSELLMRMAQFIVEIDTEKIPAEQVPYVTLRELLQYASKRKNVFRILLEKSGDHNLQEEILEILGEKVFLRLIPEDYLEEETKYLLTYATNGCFGLFYFWLMSDSEPADQVAFKMADYTVSLIKSLKKADL